MSGDMGSAAECRPALRGLALSRAEDLRAELLRAEHLKAEAMWEENSDSSRQAKITSAKNKSIRPANAPQHWLESDGLRAARGLKPVPQSMLLLQIIC